MVNKRALLPIPQSTDVLETKCIKLNIPIDPPEYRQAFIGVLINLTKWFSWERSDDQRGAQSANAFKLVLDSAITQLITDVETNNCEDIMANFRQVDCNLEYLINGVWTVIYRLQSDCVASIVNGGLQDGTIRTDNGGVGDSRTITDEMEEDSVINNDLDKVWGGCLELTEYVFETLRYILDMIQASGDALEAVNKFFGNAVETVVETVKDKNGNSKDIAKDIVIGDDGESLTDLPVDKSEAGKGLLPSTVLSIFQDVLDVGTTIIRAGLTETYLETTAGKLFNLLTCVGNTRIDENITLKKADLLNWANELFSGNLQDTFVGVVIVADTLAGEVDFLSFLNLGDVYRQYMLGTLDPFPTWSAIVDPCGDNSFVHVIDFLQGAQGFSPRIVNQSTRTNSIGWHSAGGGFGTYRESGCTRANISLGSATITNITIEYASTAIRGSFAWRLVINGANNDLPSGTGTMTFSKDGTWTGTLSLSALLHFPIAQGLTTRAIRKITITGQGTNPF